MARMASPRIYTNIETKENFRMHVDGHTDEMVLICDDTKREIKSFLAAAFTGVFYKFKDRKEIYLQSGEFYEIQNRNLPTHYKYFTANN